MVLGIRRGIIRPADSNTRCFLHFAWSDQMAFGEGPTLAVGNSMDDGAMLKYARGLALVSNPNSPEVEALAREKGWSLHRVRSSSAE